MGEYTYVLMYVPYFQPLILTHEEDSDIQHYIRVTCDRTSLTPENRKDVILLDIIEKLRYKLIYDRDGSIVTQEDIDCFYRTIDNDLYISCYDYMVYIIKFFAGQDGINGISTDNDEFETTLAYICMMSRYIFSLLTIDMVE